MIRFAIAKPEPLRVEHEAFRDAVLGNDRRHRHDGAGSRDGRRRRGRASSPPRSGPRSTVPDAMIGRGRAMNIAVVGLGKIGLPLAVQFARAGPRRHRRRRRRRESSTLVNRGDRALPRRGAPRRLARPRSSPTAAARDDRLRRRRARVRTSSSSSCRCSSTSDGDAGLRLDGRGDREHRPRTSPPARSCRLRDHPAGRHDTRRAGSRSSEQASGLAEGTRLPRRVLPRAGADRPGLRRPAQVPQARRRPVRDRRQARRRLLRGRARLRRASRPRPAATASGTSARPRRPRWPSSPRRPTATSTSASRTSSPSSPTAGHRRLRGHRGRQLTAVQPHPSARDRRRRPLHPGLSTALPVERPGRDHRPRGPRGQRRHARVRRRCSSARTEISPARGWWSSAPPIAAGSRRRRSPASSTPSRRLRPAARTSRPRPAVRPGRAQGLGFSAHAAGRPVDAAVVQTDHAEYRGFGEGISPACAPSSTGAAYSMLRGLHRRPS